MKANVLITGGAGFIGSHLADELLAHGYRVRALDNLSPQVHGPGARRPEYLHADVELIVGDTRDADTMRQALQGIDAVFHFAAAVGVGQSMYEIERYVAVNEVGTAVLLEQLADRPVDRLIVASSMSIYGEGLYRAADGALSTNAERELDDLRRSVWELHDEGGRALTPVPTPESKPPALSSVYALNKFTQERLALIVGRARNLPAVALRFFNVYGPRQALSNPYTGVLAIFAARYLNDHPPLIYEDGRQQRDFVSVHDVARACRLALETPAAAGRVFNIGSGQAQTIASVAERMGRVLGKPHIAPQVTGRYRMGDIRHCFADVRLAREILGYCPQVEFEDGLAELAGWLADQAAPDRAEAAHAELAARGLTL